MELYQGEGVKEYSRRDMLKMLVGGAAGLVGLVSCAGTQREPLNLTADMPNTMTLPNGKVICNLNGKWKHPSGREVTIEQNGINFRGYKTGEGWMQYTYSGGDRILEGTLSPVGFEKVKVFTDSSGWIPFFGKFSGSCDSFVIEGWHAPGGRGPKRHYSINYNRK